MVRKNYQAGINTILCLFCQSVISRPRVNNCPLFTPSLSFLKLHDHELGYSFESVEHAHAVGCHGLEIRNASRVQGFSHFVERNYIRQVALVVLDDERQLLEVVALLGEVDPEVLNTLEVGFHALDLRVGHEDDAVDALEDELARGVVEDLAGHRVEVEARLEAADLAEGQRQEVEEEGALGLRREGDHLPFAVGIRPLVDVLQVRRLPAETRARSRRTCS